MANVHNQMINDKKDIPKRYFNSKAYTHHDVTTFTIGEMVELFHDGGTHDIETSPLICTANQWTGFYMIRTSVMKKLQYKNIEYLKNRTCRSTMLS